MFLDEVKITVRAGDGGKGCISFRRVKYVPKGGPDGGHGGHGGNVILRADANKNTLYHFRGQKLFKAEKGHGGGGQNMAGHAGVDLILDVPVGTLVFVDGQQVADLAEPGATWLAARGGLGGKGNSNFATSTRQTPKFAELGEPGEERDLALELKLVADIGIIGLPSVGKSTLISVVSSARPKIAEYHFTTITPNLGVVSHRSEEFVVTDLPGLIKGASAGKGLGHQFLRHAERVRFFWHLVAADSTSPTTDYKTIRSELKKYNPALAEKPEIVALSKTDLLSTAELAKVHDKLQKAIINPKSKIIHLSAPIHEGLTELLDDTILELQKLKAKDLELATKIPELPTFRPHLEEKSRAFTARRQNKDLYFVDGPRLNQIVAMTDLKNQEATARVQDVLKKFGVERELRRLGAEPGAKLEIAGKRLEWWG
jgi:GTP-binding protein